ncbi:MAG: AraC family transcriptional regulator [bacterium]
MHESSPRPPASQSLAWSGGNATPLRIKETLRVPPHAHAGMHLCVITSGAFDERWRGVAHCVTGAVRLSPSDDVHEIDIIDAPFECVVLGWQRSGGDDCTDERMYGHNNIMLDQARRLATQMTFIDPLARLAARRLAAQLAAYGERFGARREPGDIPSWLHEVRDTMDRECHRPPPLRCLARVAGVHPSHVSRAFREHYGSTLREYARERRLADAVRALLSTTDTISRIAAECGFADHAHLARTMRRCLGETPSSVRAKGNA